jgi:putative inorganic carbon (HCO3(-)) transporter
MMLHARPSRATALDLGAGALAAAAVGVLSLFPGAKAVGGGLALLAGVLFGLAGWRRAPLAGPVALLLVQVGVSLWATARPDQTWIEICQLFSGLVACYAVFQWTRDVGRLWWAVAALIGAGLGLALVAPVGVDWVRQGGFLPPSLYRFFPQLLSDSVHPNVMAGALVTLLPLSLALFLALPATSRRARWLRAGVGLAGLVQLGVLLLTQSRGGYLALGVGLVLVFWLSGRRRWAAGLVVVGALAVLWLVTRPPGETAGAVATGEAAQAALNASTWAFRQQVWGAALDVIRDFPFTGTGMGTFNDVAALLYGFYAPDNPRAHNLFLQVAVDLGLPGLIAFLAIWLLALGAAWQACRRFTAMRAPLPRAVATGGLAGLVATLAHGLVDVHTWGSKGAFVPWLMIGLMLALYVLALDRPAVQGEEESVFSCLNVPVRLLP